ncbi:hypothetical protein U9M48_035105 [Paspalum notatum var. saurae]|uniref:Uncharacterized protein n=1 Tax=Paspalum notatum var. saurae TaxID=547442 RepID=A0AAQ3UB13_PASNO
MVSSNEMHNDSLPSVGDLSQENVPSTIIDDHGNEKARNDNMGKKYAHAAIAHGENNETTGIKRSILSADDLPQMESKGTIRRCQTKVSLGKLKIQTVPGLYRENKPKNKKRQKLEMHDKQSKTSDIPMVIAEFLSRNQQERKLMNDTDSLENIHTRAKDDPIDTSIVLDTNFQKSLVLEGKQKALQVYQSSTTEAANVHPQDLHMQKSSQCHAESRTEDPNNHPPESHMQNSFQRVHRNHRHISTGRKKSPLRVRHQHFYITNILLKYLLRVGTITGRSYCAVLSRQHQGTLQHQHMVFASKIYLKKLIQFPFICLGLLGEQRVAGQSGLYRRETMTATHLMDLSAAPGFRTYQRVPGNRWTFKHKLSVHNMCSMNHDQFNASPSTS